MKSVTTLGRLINGDQGNKFKSFTTSTKQKYRYYHIPAILMIFTWQKYSQTSINRHLPKAEDIHVHIQLPPAY